MTSNVIFADFRAGQRRTPSRTDRARILVSEARRAQASTRELASQAESLTHAGPALRERAARLRAAMAELDRANQKLESLSRQARAIASAKL